jgi:phosphoenolpyruvate carboxykinase (ATP)
MSTGVERARALERDGIETDRVRWNLSVAALYEEAVRRNEAVIAAGGPLACKTGQHTGRSPNDKFVVREPSSEAEIVWGKINRPMEPATFDVLHRDLLKSLAGKELFVLDCYACADPAYRLPVRIINEFAWHNLFCRNLFIDDPRAAEAGAPEFTIIDSPSFKADPVRHGTNSDVVIALNFAKRLVLIGGSSYAGEMKKSIFTVLNYVLPLRNVMPMHCSANVGTHGDVALFLRSVRHREDDALERPRAAADWRRRARLERQRRVQFRRRLLRQDHPPVGRSRAADLRDDPTLRHRCWRNVVVDPETRQLDLDDDRLTENTRAAYPISFVDNAVSSGRAGHPTNVVMLTADAFGVLPPISRLSPEAAMYHFLSGYTAKVAGTEKGVTEPKATFSTCFGAPFLPLDPSRYARMLGERIAKHRARVWLLNTGWTGGPYGVGTRMKIAYTRAMIRAALSGALDAASYQKDAVFNLDIPLSCPGVPPEVLNPAAPGLTPRPTMRRQPNSHACSPTTSRPSRRPSTPRCAARGPLREQVVSW